MEYQPIYRATLAKWGAEAQYEQMVEECAELIAALKHFQRGKIGRSELIDELADVRLMVGQLSWMLGEDQVHTAIEKKLVKLQELLDDPAGR
ncbi:MAG: antitoxin [Deltaproteobacteria bacterium]|nr:antitoxin [Deltaproteobacteria bacterium]NCP04123.1 antitoxin [Deltaproteobacteria bacterium]NCP78459.1 antitoxin [Desulfuromonadales bacterium]